MSINVDDENVTNPDNRAVGYIRVSDESQINGYSLEAQKLEIERWSLRKGFTLIKVYTEANVMPMSVQQMNPLSLLR